MYWKAKSRNGSTYCLFCCYLTALQISAPRPRHTLVTCLVDAAATCKEDVLDESARARSVFIGGKIFLENSFNNSVGYPFVILTRAEYLTA